MTIEHLKDQDLILFEAIAGSKSFGLATPSSDTDIKGVFYLPKNEFFGLDYIPQVSNETNDTVYYELGRFVELLLKNNPNILEILATPHDCILYKHPIMDNFHLEDFLSKLCKDTFAGYATTQIKKARGLKKKIINPIPEEKQSLLDFCYILEGYSSTPAKQWLAKNKLSPAKCGLVNIPHSKGMYALFYDFGNLLGYSGILKKDFANEVTISSIPRGQEELAYLFVNQEAYSSYCKDYKEYCEWIEKRNEDRYNVNKQHGKNYDSKNMMHTIRLLQSASDILTNSKLNIRVKNREELLDIKAGKIEYDDLLELSEELLNGIDEAYKTSTLQDVPDKKKAIQLLVNIRTELYK